MLTHIQYLFTVVFHSSVGFGVRSDRKYFVHVNEGVGLVDIYVHREPPFIHHMVKSSARSRHFRNFTTL